MKTKKTQLIKITSDSFKENILAVDDSLSNYIFDISTFNPAGNKSSPLGKI